jgi:hypothetical protein
MYPPFASLDERSMADLKGRLIRLLHLCHSVRQQLIADLDPAHGTPGARGRLNFIRHYMLHLQQ